MENTNSLKAIIAINNLNYIGKGGKMMWRSSEDFKHFKEKTKGGILIVGATTFEDDLGSKALPGRTMFVVGSRNIEYMTPYQAIRKAILLQESETDIDVPKRQIWLIGGASLYEQLLPLIDELHVSIINDNQIGDRKFEIPKNFKGNKFFYNFNVN